MKKTKTLEKWEILSVCTLILNGIMPEIHITNLKGDHRMIPFQYRTKSDEHVEIRTGAGNKWSVEMHLQSKDLKENEEILKCLSGTIEQIDDLLGNHEIKHNVWKNPSWIWVKWQRDFTGKNMQPEIISWILYSTLTIYNRIELIFSEIFNESRDTPEYKQWQSKVILRDKNKCIACGSSSETIELHAHHIDGYLLNKKRRLGIDNGVTLCESCHQSDDGNSFHEKYGKSFDVNKENFYVWLYEQRLRKKYSINNK